MSSDEITLRKLEIFLVFMRERHLARAAEALSLSSVSVHKAIHSLEAAVGCPLFAHRSRSLEPLDSAFVLERHASDIIERIQRSVDDTRSAAGISPSIFRIGSLYSLTVAVVPRIINALKAEVPDCDIELVLGSNADLEDKLQAGDIDAALICVHELSRRRHRIVKTLFDDEIHLAQAADAKSAGDAPVDLRRYDGEPFVMLSQEFSTGRDSYRMFLEAGITPRVALRANDIFTLTSLVKGGVGHALLPKRIDDIYPGALAFSPVVENQRVTQTIGLCYLKSRRADERIAALEKAAIAVTG
ncbi:LysR family transcriptional regulator [uncultured Salinisphaera sp.]|uniref:LysR family transcriptional regulator n=1 Tax=uncultured Salinisphaera sp. TaxID=359372 RepID=UPI0032B24702